LTSHAIAAGLSCLFDKGVYLGPLLLVSPIVAGLIINSKNIYMNDYFEKILQAEVYEVAK